MIYQERKAKLLLYTREVLPAEYPDGLARSIHFAYSRDGKVYCALHQNYGILFAPGTISAEDTIEPKGVRNPRVSVMVDGRYAITAERVNGDGSVDNTCSGQVLLWITKDFMEFEQARLVDMEALRGLVAGNEAVESRSVEGLQKQPESQIMIESGEGRAVEESEKRPEPRAAVEPGTEPGADVVLPSGAIPGCVIEISANLCDRLAQRWGRIRNTAVRVPEVIRAGSAQELQEVEATAVYSDGSTAQKRVRWNTDGVDFSRAGTYEITGTVLNEEYQFPLARGYGDPVIFPWKGRYYFIATNDNTDDVGIYVRVSDDVAGLFHAPEHLILGRDEEGNFWQTFWAPEFHLIGGELYILFAVSNQVWGPQCHLMKLKKGGDILNPGDWERPVRICRQDGSFLSTDGITLDMTYLKAGGRSYVVWSYRRHIGTPADTGSMLYIATIDEQVPWMLTSEPVLLTRPLLGWENVSGTINNEGPYSFVKDGKVYVTYSGGAANSYTYVLGLLTADGKDDLLQLPAWKKSIVPVLSFYSVDGEYGPGHNSFFEDACGNLMIAYHAEDAIDSTLRSDGIRRVHFAIDGRPVFDLSKERDLDPGLRQVKTALVVDRSILV